MKTIATVAIIVFTMTSRAWAHGFDLSVDSYSNPTSISFSSQSGYLDSNLITSSPMSNLFIENFGGNLTSGYYYAEHGFAQTAGAFPNYSGATFNITSPLYFSDGTIGSNSLASAICAPAGTYIHVYDRDFNPINNTAVFPGATGGTVDIVGNKSFSPGFGVSLYDAHELAKELFIGNGPGYGEYGFSYTITVPFTLGDGSKSTLTTGPLVDVFAVSDPNQGDFSDNAPYAQQDAATFAIYSSIMRGDFNLDGQKTIADLDLMLKALCGLNAYQASYSLPDLELQAIGDVDQDGEVTNADIQALINILIKKEANTGNATVAVPEPSSCCILLLGGAGLFSLKRKMW